MTQDMFSILDTNFKDDTPLHTVERIKGILKTYGIETEEKWNDSGVPSCYSLRVSVFGTNFGVNGKGVTKELALASGYGELMERLQLGKIFHADQQKNGDLYDHKAGEAFMSASELLERNRKWYSSYCKKAQLQTGAVLTEEDLLAQFCDESGNTYVTPFYCVNTKTTEYLPTPLLNVVYTTNGCAAGNTMEEALVQAMSEIVERHYSAQVLSEGLTVPDFPEEVLQACPVAYQIITFLRENGFEVTVKDCSLGTKFPVVCVCLIDKKTGKYHTHFGAYPHFEIALQRTLTESFQGRNIQKVAQFDNFFRTKKQGFDVGNLLNQLVKGTSERTPEFFTASAEPYQKTCGFAGKNNQELLQECVDFFVEMGYDILIRDYSCLGFPTYQVIIPGYSEVFTYRFDNSQNNTRFYHYGQIVLRDPSAATLEEIMGFLMNLNQMAKRQLGQPRFSSQANIPIHLSSDEEIYLMNATMANLNYTLGRNSETVKYIDKMLSTGIDTDAAQLICIKRYLNLTADGYTQDEIRCILERFHQPEIVNWLYSSIAEGKNLMEPFVLHCDLQCHPTCLFYSKCMKKRTDELAQFISAKQREIDRSQLGIQLSKLL